MSKIRDHSRAGSGDHSDREIKYQDGIKPGTAAFGQRAAARRAGIIERGRRGDLRVQTGKKRVQEHVSERNKILKGDY